jgi:hypothetical protein
MHPQDRSRSAAALVCVNTPGAAVATVTGTGVDSASPVCTISTCEELGVTSKGTMASICTPAVKYSGNASPPRKTCVDPNEAG